MADIRLISIVPTANVAGVQPAQVPQGGGSPSALANIPSGTTLSGFIINRDSSGNPILRTDSGDVAFSSDYFLKIGSEVVIRVVNSGGNPLARILSVNGQPPEIAQAQSSFAEQPEVIVSSNLSTLETSLPQTPQSPLLQTTTANINAPAQPPLPSPTVTAQAILLTPTNGYNGQPLLPAGTTLQLRIVTLAPAAETPPAPTPAATNIPAPPAATAPTATNTPPIASAFYATYARASGTGLAPPTALVTAPIIATSLPTPPAQPQSAAPLPPAQQPATSIPTVTAQAAHAVPLIAPASGVPSAPTPTTPTSTETVIAKPPVPQPATQPSASPNTAQPTPIIATATAATNIAQPAATPAAAQAPLTAMSLPTTPTPAQAPITPTPVSLPLLYNTPQKGEMISAVALGNEPTGEAVLQTQLGTVRLNIGTVLPPGSKLTFEIAQIAPPTTTATSAATTPLTTLAQHWPALQEIFSLLSARDNALGLDFVPSAMPWISPNVSNNFPSAPPQNMPTGLLLFIAALRGNDFSNWIGKTNIDWLKDQGQDALVKKAGDEFMALGRQFLEPPSQNWQTLFFPIGVGGELQQVRMFLKRDRKQGGQGKKDEDTRFIVEMDLSQLGEMQMDGFVRNRGQDTQFDLIIRSLTPLSNEIRKDILQIYNDTGSLTGYKGSLAFQAVKEFPIHPMEDLLAHAMNTVVA